MAPSIATNLFSFPSELLPDIICEMFPGQDMGTEQSFDHNHLTYLRHAKFFRNILFNSSIIKFLNPQMRCKCLERLDSLLSYLDNPPARLENGVTKRTRVYRAHSKHWIASNWQWAVRNIIALFIFMNLILKMYFKTSFALEGVIKIAVRMFHIDPDLIKIDLIKSREVEVFQNCYKLTNHPTSLDFAEVYLLSLYVKYKRRSNHMQLPFGVLAELADLYMLDFDSLAHAVRRKLRVCLLKPHVVGAMLTWTALQVIGIENVTGADVEKLDSGHTDDCYMRIASDIALLSRCSISDVIAFSQIFVNLSLND